jgi:hypothetical protein
MQLYFYRNSCFHCIFSTTLAASLFGGLLLLLVEDVLVDLQFLVDEIFVGLGDGAGHEKFVKDEVGLGGGEGTWVRRELPCGS